MLNKFCVFPSLQVGTLLLSVAGFFLFFAQGCRPSYERCAKFYGNEILSDTVFTDHVISVPVQAFVPYDIASLTLPKLPAQTQWLNDPIQISSGRALLTVYKTDSIYILAECLPDTITDTIQQVIRTPATIYREHKFSPKPKITTFDWMLICLFTFVIGALLGFVIRR
jgi:hypothetical protein